MQGVLNQPIYIVSFRSFAQCDVYMDRTKLEEGMERMKDRHPLVTNSRVR